MIKITIATKLAIFLVQNKIKDRSSVNEFKEGILEIILAQKPTSLKAKINDFIDKLGCSLTNNKVHQTNATVGLYELICILDCFSKNKHFQSPILYLDEISTFMREVKNTQDDSKLKWRQQKKMLSLLDLDSRDTSKKKSREEKSTEVQHKWGQMIANFLSDKEDSIDKLTIDNIFGLYLEIAKCSISKSSGLSYGNTALLIDMSIPRDAILRYSALELANSDELLPNKILSSEDGKYFICKITRDDSRAPFIGIPTGCCQHMKKDDFFATIARFSCTQANACVYVMFRGKPPVADENGLINTKRIVTNRIIGQTCAWTVDNGKTIVFDSIEISPADSCKDEAVKLFNEFAKILVINSNNTTKVLVGGSGNALRYGGIYCGDPHVEPPKGIYTDAGPQKQKMLYSKSHETDCLEVLERLNSIYTCRIAYENSTILQHIVKLTKDYLCRAIVEAVFSEDTKQLNTILEDQVLNKFNKKCLGQLIIKEAVEELVQTADHDRQHIMENLALLLNCMTDVDFTRLLKYVANRGNCINLMVLLSERAVNVNFNELFVYAIKYTQVNDGVDILAKKINKNEYIDVECRKIVYRLIRANTSISHKKLKCLIMNGLVDVNHFERIITHVDKHVPTYPSLTILAVANTNLDAFEMLLENGATIDDDLRNSCKDPKTLEILNKFEKKEPLIFSEINLQKSQHQPSNKRLKCQSMMI